MTVRRHPHSPYWYYDFWFRKRRYQGSTRQTSKVKAREYERQLINELEAGHDPLSKSPLMKDLEAQYKTWIEVNRSTDHTDRSKRAIRNVLSRMKGVRVAEDVTPSKIEDFKTRRLGEGMSPFTVNLELRHFKAFLKRCVKQGWLQKMPVEIEQIKTPGRGRVVFLSEDEIYPFLDQLRPWARQAARFILLTGLRLDEVRFLEWQDIDLEGGELWIHDKPEFGFSPKGGKERRVPLPPDLIEELHSRIPKDGWVLRGANGGKIDRRTFQRAVAAAGKAAVSQKSISPHTLRHTYGSRWAKAGKPLHTLKEIMGHSTITTTEIYLHTDAEHRRQAVSDLRLPEREEREEKVIPLRE
jgi:integrase